MARRVGRSAEHALELVDHKERLSQFRAYPTLTGTRRMRRGPTIHHGGRRLSLWLEELSIAAAERPLTRVQRPLWSVQRMSLK